MGTINKLDIVQQTPYIGPHGNTWVKTFQMETDSNGVVVNGDSDSPLANGDVVILGVLPAGLKLLPHEAVVANSDAYSSSQTFKVGFKYVDGTDDAAFPQDDDYFTTATAADAQNITRGNNAAVRPNVLPKDAYLILTNGGADAAAVGKTDITIKGEYVGTA